MEFHRSIKRVVVLVFRAGHADAARPLRSPRPATGSAVARLAAAPPGSGRRGVPLAGGAEELEARGQPHAHLQPVRRHRGVLLGLRPPHTGVRAAGRRRRVSDPPFETTPPFPLNGVNSRGLSAPPCLSGFL